MLCSAPLSAIPRVSPAAAARLVRSYVTSPGFEAANAAMRAGVLSDVERIDVPVTLAWGELDRLIRRPRTKPVHWRSVPAAAVTSPPGTTRPRCRERS